MNPKKSQFVISCATQLPWHDHLFRLISWLDMLEIDIKNYQKIAAYLGSDFIAESVRAHAAGDSRELENFIMEMHGECFAAKLTQSSAQIASLLMEMPCFGSGTMHAEHLGGRLTALLETIKNELTGGPRFFCMPSEKALERVMHFDEGWN